jgi:sugar (pentulose or hexulose) kinase
MKRIPCFALDEKSFVLEAVIGTSGAAFKWMKNMFNMDYGDMCSLAEISSVGSNGVFFYPHLNGASSPSWSEEAKGLFYGLTLSTKKSDMMRGLLEGIAFQIKTNLDVCEEVSGEKINEIRLFGGGAKNVIWCEIIANVTGKCVNVSITPETACIGAALLAGGKHEQKTRKTYKPEKALFELYEEIYSRYIMLEEKIY